MGNYQAPYVEDDTKVVLMFAPVSCGEEHGFSHHPGEPVPYQLAGRFTQDEWKNFLEDISNSLPSTKMLPFAFGGAVFCMILGTVIDGYIEGLGSLLTFSSFVGLIIFVFRFQARASRAYQAIVERHCPVLQAKGIMFSRHITGGGDHRSDLDLRRKEAFGDTGHPCRHHG